MNLAVRLFGCFLILVQLKAAVITVANTAQLVSALQSSSNGDTIQMQDGTYTVTGGGGIGIDILKAITLKSINGVSHVTISAPNLYIAVRVGVPNVTLDGLTINGAQWGVQASDWTNAYGGHITGIVFRNLNTSTTGNGGQALVSRAPAIP